MDISIITNQWFELALTLSDIRDITKLAWSLIIHGYFYIFLFNS